jgi:deoxyribose-phosphate aldolase
MQEIAQLCDHTFLLPTEAFRSLAKSGESAVRLRRDAFDRFLAETLALPLRPYAVCVRAADVGYVKPLLPREIKLAATVGFPDGSRHSTAYKLAETDAALAEGANEIDMVIDVDALKAGDDARVLSDLVSIVSLGGVLKVILEISELTETEIMRACQLVTEAGAAFVKTSTGFSAHGATEKALCLMRQHFKGGVKISGGVNKENVDRLIRAATEGTEEISLDPMKLRIGESTLLQQLCQGAV